MNSASALTQSDDDNATERWQALLSDRAALLSHPGAHHKALLEQAHLLYRQALIDSDRLSDLLELADSALAFAVESILDIDSEK